MRQARFFGLDWVRTGDYSGAFMDWTGNGWATSVALECSAQAMARMGHGLDVCHAVDNHYYRNVNVNGGRFGQMIFRFFDVIGCVDEVAVW